MEYIISVIWVIIEGISFYLLHDAFLARRIQSKKAQWLILPQSVLIGILNCVGIEKIIIISISFAANYLLYSFLFKGSVVWHIFLIILSAILTGIIDTNFLYGFSLIFDISVEALVWQKLKYTTIVSIGKLLHL